MVPAFHSVCPCTLSMHDVVLTGAPLLACRTLFYIHVNWRAGQSLFHSHCLSELKGSRF